MSEKTISGTRKRFLREPLLEAGVPLLSPLLTAFLEITIPPSSRMGASHLKEPRRNTRSPRGQEASQRRLLHQGVSREVPHLKEPRRNTRSLRGQEASRRRLSHRSLSKSSKTRKPFGGSDTVRTALLAPDLNLSEMLQVGEDQNRSLSSPPSVMTTLSNSLSSRVSW